MVTAPPSSSSKNKAPKHQILYSTSNNNSPTVSSDYSLHSWKSLWRNHVVHQTTPTYCVSSTNKRCVYCLPQLSDTFRIYRRNQKSSTLLITFTNRWGDRTTDCLTASTFTGVRTVFGPPVVSSSILICSTYWIHPPQTRVLTRDPTTASELEMSAEGPLNGD